MRGAEKEGFKPPRERGSEGRPCPYTASGSQPGSASGIRGPHPVDDVSTGGSPYKYWNEDALSRWLGPENLGGPSWMVSGPGCWSIMAPELTR